MIKCERCDKKIDIDSRFCKYCGAVTDINSGEQAESAKYCAGCGARIPVGGMYCVVCGIKAGQAPLKTPEQPDLSRLPESRFATGTFSAIIPEVGPSTTSSVASDKKTMSGAALLMLLVLLAGVGIVAAWRFLPYVLPVDVPPIGEGIAYIKDGNTLMLSYPDRELYQISDDYAPPSGKLEETAKTGPDGRYLVYMNTKGFSDGSGLYLLDLSRLNRPDMQKPEGTLVSENAVKDFEFSLKGNYLVYLSSKGGLYAYDYKNLWLLDTDVAKIIEVGEKQVLYSKNTPSSAGRYDIYLRSVDREADDKVQVAQNTIKLLDWTPGFSSFIYTQPQQNGNLSRSLADVMHYNARLYQTQTLVSGVDVVLDASAEQVSVVYAKQSAVTLRYDNLISDPLASNDRLMRMPKPEDYGLPENYEEIFEEKADTGDRQSELELEDMYYEAYEAYQKAVRSYEERNTRETQRLRARQAISELSYSALYNYEIFVYRDNAIRTIDEGVIPMRSGVWQEDLEDIASCVISDGYIVYVRSLFSEVSRLNLSAFAEDMPDVDIDNHLLSKIPRQLCVSTFTAEPMIIYKHTGKTRVTDMEVTPGMSGIYYTTNPSDMEDAGKELYYSEIIEGVPQQPLIIDHGVDILAGAKERFNESVVYIKDVDRGVGDLYVIRDNQNPFGIAEDISVEPGFKVVNSGKSMIYYRRYGQSGGGQAKGELYLIERQERFIVGGVYVHDYRSDKLIYLIRDKSDAGAGELCVYREGGVSPIDTGVTDIISLHK